VKSAELPASLARFRPGAVAWRDVWGARGADIASLVLAAALAAQLAVLAWQFVPGAKRQRPTVAPVLRQAQPFDLDSLVSAHVFGAPPAEGGAVAATRAPLVLTATLATADPGHGWAVMGENAGTAKLTAVGAMLSGVKLTAVYPDHVLLDRGGVIESLALPRQFSGSGGKLPGMPDNRAGPAAAAIGPSVQRLIAQDPGVVGQVIRPQPVFSGGQLRGFRLYPGADRSKFARLGLEAGDVVTAVNGVPLADAQHGMEILRGLANAGSADVTIERGGQTQVLSVDASKIAAVAAPDTATVTGPGANTNRPAPDND
jgi:general secretion pathway protein C